MALAYFCYIGCSILMKEVCRAVHQNPARSGRQSVAPTRVDLRFLPAGLHERPKILQQLLQKEIDTVEEYVQLEGQSPLCRETYQALLLGYGLCSEATVGLRARRIPLVVPRAHDCITILLGSKERHQKLFAENSANYWYSSGWIERMLPPGPEREKQLSEKFLQRYGQENLSFLLESESHWQERYCQATLIISQADGVEQNKAYRAYTQNCASHLGWEYREVSSDLTMLTDLLKGAWDPERFLIVQPGSEIIPSFNDQIITTKECTGNV
ncbi:DUF1638 domain-containing protein [Hydrogenispora ethanolica]|uniref:DUF1638 domain-containing protein n=1 Tax=Hydrogenispora ethanolica TaxID=1082276 RepID=UPI001404D6EA|nr:DUF1638 domain-containing protein [Hydrogenispora ethanolica]